MASPSSCLNSKLLRNPQKRPLLDLLSRPMAPHSHAAAPPAHDLLPDQCFADACSHDAEHHQQERHKQEGADLLPSKKVRRTLSSSPSPAPRSPCSQQSSSCVSVCSSSPSTERRVLHRAQFQEICQRNAKPAANDQYGEFSAESCCLAACSCHHMSDDLAAELESSATSSCVVEEWHNSPRSPLSDGEAVESCSGEEAQLLDISCFFDISWKGGEGERGREEGGRDPLMSFDPATVFQINEQSSLMMMEGEEGEYSCACADACVQDLLAQPCLAEENWFLQSGTEEDAMVLAAGCQSGGDGAWMAEAIANLDKFNDVLNTDVCVLHFLESGAGL